MMALFCVSAAFWALSNGLADILNGILTVLAILVVRGGE